MGIRSAVVTQEWIVRLSGSQQLQRKRPPFVSLTLLIFLSSVILIFGVLAGVRTQPAPQPVNLPQHYLPGSPLPTNASCDRLLPSGETFLCSIHYEDNHVYISFNPATNMISRSLIRTHDYTIGQLLAAWGRPTGITRTQTVAYVYWDTRSALLNSNSVRPDSIVEFILYNPEPPFASPWRGFRLFE